ncbi:MAG: MFS transporter [Chloroflexia bacterium]
MTDNFEPVIITAPPNCQSGLRYVHQGTPGVATVTTAAPRQVTASPAGSPTASLWHNRTFNIFWAGRSLSAIGDAFALIALPLLVLQATGSVLQMGLVTGIYGAGHFLASFFAGAIADRADRRRLMIALNVSSFTLFSLIPLGWALGGPQISLVYVVVGLGAVIDMIFQVTYATVVPNLVRPDQITAANGRLTATAALAFTLGPIAAGILSVRFGPVVAIGVDAASFLVSAASLSIIRLRPHAVGAAPGAATQVAPKGKEGRKGGMAELAEGIRFVWDQPVLRAMALLTLGASLCLPAGLDLFIFHIKNDLGGSDSAVGLVAGLAGIGSIVAGLLVGRIRNRFGFGACWLGGAAAASIAFGLFGLSPLVALAAGCSIAFAFSDGLRGIAALSLRQQITPDLLMGRVTSAFWMVATGPGAISAAVTTALANEFGATPMMVIAGLGSLIVAAAGLFTPARGRTPEVAGMRGVAVAGD